MKGTVNEDGEVFIEGVVMDLSQPTMNGRVYPQHLFERELDRLKPRVERKDVPVFNGTRETLHKVMGILEDIGIEGSEVKARVRVLDVRHGELAKTMIRADRTFRMGPNGHGTVGEDGVVGDDYTLTSFSIVVED